MRLRGITLGVKKLMGLKTSEIIHIIIAAGILLTSVACTVGPKYVKPAAAVPMHYKEMEGWKVARPADTAIRGAWWRLFNDPFLNSLEADINITNQNIIQAEAQYRQALALVKAARAGYFPTITAGASYTRSRTLAVAAHPASSTNFSVYSLPVDATWDLDVWGKARRAVEANLANAQASEADLESALLSAQTSLAQDYFQLRALDTQKKILDDTAMAYRESLKLTKNLYKGGVVSMADVLQSETQLKTTQAQAVDIGVQRSQLEHAIALLIGKPPSNFSLPFSPFDVTVPLSLPEIPVGLPSELLERRPDIASAERNVAAANAQIGIAEAAFYPTVTLSASAGFQSSSLSDWVSWPSRFWAVGPAIAEAIFDGGLRRALTEEARATYDANVAFYRQTVLSSFQQVEDNLAALRILEEEAHAQSEAVKAADQTVEVITNQYKAGIVSYLNVISAQTIALNNERTAAQIMGNRLTAAVLLIKALGGGWNISALSLNNNRNTRTDTLPQSGGNAALPSLRKKL
jgi:NodT family efflux transporter outer membrane factor (OMF) lipoprotein